MMVGQSGCGKTTAWRILLNALHKKKGKFYVIDPKAIAKEDLYGKFDNKTLEWTDGVFTLILRRITENQRDEGSKTHWIVFDGRVAVLILRRCGPGVGGEFELGAGRQQGAHAAERRENLDPAEREDFVRGGDAEVRDAGDGESMRYCLVQRRYYHVLDDVQVVLAQVDVRGEGL